MKAMEAGMHFIQLASAWVSEVQEMQATHGEIPESCIEDFSVDFQRYIADALRGRVGVDPSHAIFGGGPSVTVGYVKSESDSERKYTIIQMGDGHWECNCKSFFHGSRSQPCKHIDKMRTLHRVKPGQLTLKAVELTNKGEDILRQWRREHDMPEVRPEG